MTYTNTRIYHGLDWQQYIALPGKSHSTVKQTTSGIYFPVTATTKMAIGTLVDGMLTAPATVDMRHDLYSHAKIIAAELMKMFGPLLAKMQKQVSFTADIELQQAPYSDAIQCDCLHLLTKGRPDFLLPNVAILDLKVTSSKDIDGLIEYMGYKNQVWHYSKGCGVKQGYLLVYSIPLKKAVVRPVEITPFNAFWADAVVMHGEVK